MIHFNRTKQPEKEMFFTNRELTNQHNAISKNWTTNDELAFISQALTNREKLEGYISGGAKRKHWAKMDKSKILKAAHNALDGLK